MAITRKTWYGIARETTPGTPIATPTMFLPLKGVTKFNRKTEYTKEERGSRDTNYSAVYLTRQGTSDFKGGLYADALGYFLLGMFGSVVSTQPDATNAPTAWQHVFSYADVPPSFTIFKSYDSAVYQMPYSCVEKLSIKIVAEGKVCEIDSTLGGMFPVLKAGPFTPTFSSVRPIPGYSCTITNSLGTTTDIDDLSIEFDQKVSPWFSASGSPDLSTMYFGERTAKVDFTARFDTTTLFNLFLNNTEDSLSVQIIGDLIGGTTVHYFQQLNLAFSDISYDTFEHDLGKENVLVKAKATAHATSTNPLSTCTLFTTKSSYAT